MLKLPNNFFTLLFYYFLSGIILLTFLVFTSSSLAQTLMLTLFFPFFLLSVPFIATVYAQNWLLVPIVFLPFFVVCTYSFVLLTKRTIQMSARLLCIFLVWMGIFLYIYPFTTTYPVSVEFEAEKSVEESTDKLKKIYASAFDTAAACDQNMDSRSIYFEATADATESARLRACQQQVSTQIFEILDGEVIHSNSYVFVKLKEDSGGKTLQVLGLNGKLFELKYCEQACSYVQSQQNKLFDMLKAQRTTQPYHSEMWREVVKALFQNTLGDFIRGEGVHYIGFGESEVVVPVDVDGERVGILVLFYGD